MDKYKNKYRIKSARAWWWNYSWAAAYFVTICTKDKEHFFCHIQSGFMCVNNIGAVVWKAWLETLQLRPDMNIRLGEFVVMPNHVHGIIVIGDNAYNQDESTINSASEKIQTFPLNKFGPQRKNLAAIIRGFKGKVTKNAQIINPLFGWQARFHDHIIRNENAYDTISNYIDYNPMNWEKDSLFTQEKNM